MNSNTPHYCGNFDQDSTIETPHGRVQYDSSLEAYRLHHDWTINHSLSTTVLSVIEVASSKSMDELPPLYEIIEPDALDELFTPTNSDESRTGCRVTFQYVGFFVTIDADETITVQPVHSEEETQ